MKNMESTLPKDKFARVHRSYIVAIDKVTSLSGTEVFIDKKQIPIGKNYKDSFLQSMSQSKFLK
jgi:DNA-binding LytR/AlgR family response regulator